MITLFDHAFFDHVSDAALPQPLFNAVSRTYEEHVHKTELRFDANAVWIGQCLNRVCIQAPRASLEVPTITAFEHGVDDHLFRALRRSWPACKPAWSPVTATALRHPDELLPAGPTQGFLASRPRWIPRVVWRSGNPATPRRRWQCRCLRLRVH
jgi:hypothetical protein